MNITHGSRRPEHDKGFTLVELLIVIVILGILATVTVFAVRGITDQGSDKAVAGDERTLAGAEEAHMARFGNYATEAELVSAGLLRDESSIHDITVGPGDAYSIVTAGSGGGGGNATLGTATTWAGVPALEYGAGQPFVIIGGATAGAQWDAEITATTPVGSRMIFVDVADITTLAQAEGVHDASLPYPRVWSLADDVPNFDGAAPMTEFMETSNGGGPQTYTKINDGGPLDVAWAFNAS